MNTVSERSFEKALDKIRELSKHNAALKRENEALKASIRRLAEIEAEAKEKP